MGERPKLHRDRISRGLCPNCGGEAAPYYLCWKCRAVAKIGRILRRAEKAGGVNADRSARKTLWRMKSADAWDTIAWRADPKAGDGRLKPRMRGIPVDVENTLRQILVDADRGLTEADVFAAWGKLRAKREAPLHADMSRIIAAQRKREAKMARRANQAPSVAQDVDAAADVSPSPATGGERPAHAPPQPSPLGLEGP